jgi:hypothetical protein
VVSGASFGLSSWMLFSLFYEISKNRWPARLMAASSFLVGSLSFPFFLYGLAGQSGYHAGAGPKQFEHVTGSAHDYGYT